MDKLDHKQTLIEEGTEFRGTMLSTVRVTVHGRFEGEVEAPELSVAPSGTVVGTVRAGKIRSEGVLSGTIEADEVQLSGQVRGETTIRASKLEVRLAREDGKLELSFGEAHPLTAQPSAQPSAKDRATAFTGTEEAAASVGSAPAAENGASAE